jgi:hypothetical protein
MKLAVIGALAIAVAACAPPPPPAPAPVALYDPVRVDECARIRYEIGVQQRIAAFSDVMSGLLVEAAVRLNAYNVITGLQTRAAIIGCG